MNLDLTGMPLSYGEFSPYAVYFAELLRFDRF